MGDYTQHFSIKVGSEKSFGIIFGLIFGILGVWPLLFGDGSVRLWSLAVGGGFLLVTVARPTLLRPLNQLWFQFGIALGKMISPVIMIVLFLTTVTPIALIMRALGKDPLKLKLDPNARTYWVERPEPGPKSGSMRNQF